MRDQAGLYIKKCGFPMRKDRGLIDYIQVIFFSV